MRFLPMGGRSILVKRYTCEKTLYNGRSILILLFHILIVPHLQTQDEPSSSDSAKRKCGCNEDAILLTTKNGSNAGRKFWKCDNGGKCEFWEWDDKPAKSSWAPSGSSTMPGRIQSFNGGSGNDKSSDTCYKVQPIYFLMNHH